MRLAPDGVTGKSPGRANTDEPVGLDAREVVAQDDEKHADADRHEAVDLHGIAEAGREDHPVREQHEDDDGVRDQPVGADELAVVLAPRVQSGHHVEQPRDDQDDGWHDGDGQRPIGESIRRAAQIPVGRDGGRQLRIGPDGQSHGDRGDDETKPAATHACLPPRRSGS